MKLDIDYIRYSKHNILNDTSLNLNKGIIGIYGKNGEGKSTLLKVLSDFFQHKSNILISLDSMEIKNTRDYILYHTSYFSIEEKENLRVFLENINYRHQKNIHKLSSGNLNKLNLAISLSQEKDIYILDEPFNALDNESVEKLCVLLEEKRKSDKLLIVVTHNIESYNHIFDELYNLRDGKLLKRSNDIKYICRIKLGDLQIEDYLNNLIEIERYPAFNHDVYKFNSKDLDICRRQVEFYTFCSFAVYTSAENIRCRFFIR